MTTIREQILSAIGTKLAQIQASAGYETEMGDHVFRSFLPPVDFQYTPAVGFMPKSETVNRHGHLQENNLQIQIQGISKWATGETAAEKAEQILADIQENILGLEYSLDFNSGGTYEPQIGDTIEGNTSGATGYLSAISIDSGSWAGGDAAGSLTFRRLSGNFTSGEVLNIGSNDDVATLTGSESGQSAAATTTGGLADAIRMLTDEVTAPEAEQESVGASIVFEISYKSQVGNPYSQ